MAKKRMVTTTHSPIDGTEWEITAEVTGGTRECAPTWSHGGLPAEPPEADITRIELSLGEGMGSLTLNLDYVHMVLGDEGWNALLRQCEDQAADDSDDDCNPNDDNWRGE
jgi:hypothetical protein